MNVNYWPKADISYCSAHVHFWGRADMGKLYSTHCAPHRSLIFRADFFGQSAVI
jgi:hypothetical protein